MSIQVIMLHRVDWFASAISCLTSESHFDASPMLELQDNNYLLSYVENIIE
jgi:hypothetical protein